MKNRTILLVAAIIIVAIIIYTAKRSEAFGPVNSSIALPKQTCYDLCESRYQNSTGLRKAYWAPIQRSICMRKCDYATFYPQI